VPNNGVVVPPKIKEEPSARELGTTRACGVTVVRDCFSPLASFAKKASTTRACGGTVRACGGTTRTCGGTAHACGGTVVPRFQLLSFVFFLT